MSVCAVTGVACLAVGFLGYEGPGSDGSPRASPELSAWPGASGALAAAVPSGQPLVPTDPQSPVRDFSKHSVLPGAPLRNRTVDLLLTISTAPSAERASCTDPTGYSTDSTGCAGIIRRAVPRDVPRAPPGTVPPTS
jgi:hypothetical protein